MDGLSATKIIMTEFPESKRPTVIAMTAKFEPLYLTPLTLSSAMVSIPPNVGRL